MTARRTTAYPWIALLVAGALTLSVGLVASGAPAGGAESDAANTERTSALLVQPIHDAQVVRGDDGMDHVEYELMVVNVFSDPVTLTSVTVLDPAGKELARIDGATLAAGTQALLTKAPAPVVNPSAAVAVDVDLALKPGTVPKRVTHRIDYTLPDPQHAVIVDDTVVQGPEVAIERRAPIVLAAPLAGEGWLASSGCCAPNVHRDLRLAIDGARIETSETFAVDWARVEGERIYDGDGTQNEQHYAFGADVLAVADATVVFLQDGQPEQLPNVTHGPDQAKADFGGNQVVLELEPHVFAVYAHLQPGSITVKVGDKVKAGQHARQPREHGPVQRPAPALRAPRQAQPLRRPEPAVRPRTLHARRHHRLRHVDGRPPGDRAGVEAGPSRLSAVRRHPELPRDPDPPRRGGVE